MINSIRRRLILLYTLSTGLILTIVLIFVFLIMKQQLLNSKISAFQNEYFSVNKNVQNSHTIRNLWLAEMENRNRCIIHIEDNGTALLYSGAWKMPTGREILVNRVKDLARKDHIDTDLRPISQTEIQSQIYQLKGNANDKYLGEVFIIPIKNGYRSVVMLQYISEPFSDTIGRILLFFLLEGIGICAFFFISWWIVGKSLQPVEESRRRQNDFIAAASHELKSPLAVIRANASALMIEPERSRHFSQGIEQECRRLSALIEDMLLLASVDAKNWAIKKEVIDMDTLCIDTYDTYLPFCLEQGKQLKLELQEQILPGIEGDILRVKQILAVLLDNAVSYTTQGDTIILSVKAKRNELMIEVIDHGPGISEDHKAEIFNRFYRGDKSRRDKHHFGLGLSIAKELIELHHGTIMAKDTPGGGATFCISLPAIRGQSYADEITGRMTSEK